MEKLISQESKDSLLKLGLYQIVGGILGLIRFVFVTVSMGKVNGLTILLAMIVAVLFAYSIFSGWQCIKLKKSALINSYINQGLQIVSFSIVGFAYKYIAGIYLGLGVNLTNSLEFRLDAGFSNYALAAFI